jgi:polyphosphate kinase
LFLPSPFSNLAVHSGNYPELFEMDTKENEVLTEQSSNPIARFVEMVWAYTKGKTPEKVNRSIGEAEFISRDLSWLQFNFRVLDQARSGGRNLFERMKFLAITASNFDEFFMIRVGSLYNYLDVGRERLDYSGLREVPFRKTLLTESQEFYKAQEKLYFKELLPQFRKNGLEIVKIAQLDQRELQLVEEHFNRTIHPMLTPMMLDVYHTFPIVLNKTLTFGVVTRMEENPKNPLRLSFVQVPQNLPRFFDLDRGEITALLPVEEIIRWQIHRLFRNVEIESINLFRILRNGDISIEESDDVESDLVDEVKRQLSNRKTGRVVRVDVEENYSAHMMKVLKERWDVDEDNIFVTRNLIDYTALWQIIQRPEFSEKLPLPPLSVPPVFFPNDARKGSIFEILKKRDILLHHPFNSIDIVLKMLEEAAVDPHVLSIKITIYRLAKNSRIIETLLKAAENGKYVSVLFEVKARFDEENNIRQAQRLQKAGCFVIYGLGSFKTHTKLCLIVRKEDDQVTRFVHLSSGNYNEDTSRIYTDIGLLTSGETYASDVSEFFNVITGHSKPDQYRYLITAPRDMRNQLIEMMQREAENARKGLPSGIVLKVNSLEDKRIIEELYKTSAAGVPVRLIVRGICCLRPARQGLSENISVKSIVGDLLEHTRLYYFHNAGDPLIYGGSADMMNRSFDRRLESLFLLVDPNLKKLAVAILDYNLLDNVNSYFMTEDGSYVKYQLQEGEPEINVHRDFYNLSEQDLKKSGLF